MSKRTRQKIESEFGNNNISEKNYNLLKTDIDQINLKIIEELLNNPDIKNANLAKKLQIPLSTLQRRKTRIESHILKKYYHFDFSQLGFRMAEIYLHIESGKTDEVAHMLLKTLNKNILKISSRIDSTTNLCIEVIFKDSIELHHILENLRSIEYSSNIIFSEVVNVIGNNINNICISMMKDEFDIK